MVKKTAPQTIEVNGRSVSDFIETIETPKRKSKKVIVEETIVESMTPVVPVRTNKNAIALDSEGKIDLTAYTPTEIEKFTSLNNKLNTSDTNSIINYGVDVQNKLGVQSDKFLTNVRTFDAGEIGGSINDLLTEINYLDVDVSEKNAVQRFISHIPFLKKIVNSTQKIFQKYDSVSTNVDKITKKLDQGRLSIIKDNVMLNNLFDENLEFIESLQDLIISGKIKHDELKAELVEMELAPQNYEDYEFADKRDFVDRLGKRLHDMELTRVITIQSLPQIRLVQNNNATMVEKVQSSINTTIPIWKQQISIAVSLMSQQKMAEVNNKFYETTNLMLTKNAEMLKTNSISIATQNERGIVSMESIKIVQDRLIETLDEIKKIKTEGESNRKAVEKELMSLEQNLQNKVQQLN